MLAGFDFVEMTAFTIAVIVACYFAGTFVNEILGREAFGANGNAIVMTAGVFGGLWLSHEYGYPQNNYIHLAIIGIASAFILITLLTIMKIGARRLGM